VLFLTLELTAIRRFEARRLRWRDIDLIENVLKVVDSKSEKGFRSIALSPTLAEELWQLRRSSAYDGDAEYVFAHPTLGNPLNPDWYKRELRAAITKAGLSERFPSGPTRTCRAGAAAVYAPSTMRGTPRSPTTRRQVRANSP
jgi:integrase